MPASGINDQMKKLCVKIRVEGGRYANRKEVLKAILESSGCQEKDLCFLYQLEKGREWYVIFKNRDDCARCVESGGCSLSENTSLNFEKLTRQRVTVRVHWLPPYVSDDIIIDVLEKFGEIIDFQTLWDIDTHVKGCIREVRMILDDEGRDELPHIITFNDGRLKVLVTCPGRAPYCVKCGELGHVRASCSQQGQRRPAASYADTVRQHSQVPAPEAQQEVAPLETMDSSLIPAGQPPKTSETVDEIPAADISALGLIDISDTPSSDTAPPLDILSSGSENISNTVVRPDPERYGERSHKKQRTGSPRKEVKRPREPALPTGRTMPNLLPLPNQPSVLEGSPMNESESECVDFSYHIEPDY